MKTKTKDDYRKSSINKRDFVFPNFQGIYPKKQKKGANRLWVAKDEWKPLTKKGNHYNRKTVTKK